jgi:hypothetical protein
MPRTAGPFHAYKRRDTQKYHITLYPASGLPPEICQNWKRKAFSCFPLELAVFREPKTGSAAETGALALIEFLKNRLKTPDVPQDGSHLPQKFRGPTVGSWLERLTSPDDNPHAARLIAEGLPYSSGTLAMYQDNYKRYLKDDPFMRLDMNMAKQADVLTFMARLGSRKTRDKRDLAGTRTFEIIIRFVRMAFKEYGEDHEDWKNPFGRIKAPKTKD